MRHIPFQLFLRILALLSMGLPSAALAQSKNHASSAEPGWGSEWIKPATPVQDVYRKIDAAWTAQDYRAALALCRQLFSLMPDSPDPYYIRAVTFTQLERYKDALPDLERAEAIAEKRGLRNLLGAIYRVRVRIDGKKKDNAAAVKDLYTAIRFNPADRLSLNTLAWFRAVVDDPAYRNGTESIKLAQKVIALDGADPGYTDVDTLAAGYAETRDFSRAVDAEKRALALAGKQLKDSAGLALFEADGKARLQLYEQHQPYHSATW